MAFLLPFDWNLSSLKQAYVIRRGGLKYLLNFYLFFNGPLFSFHPLKNQTAYLATPRSSLK